MKELVERDVVPFRHAVEAGVDMMMMSHVAFPMGRDDLVPASFDSGIIHPMLRESLNFKGVVITDALEMAGARWKPQTAFPFQAAWAFQHGAKKLPHMPELEQCNGAPNELNDLVNSGIPDFTPHELRQRSGPPREAR